MTAVIAVLLFILKTIGILLAAVLILLLAVLLIPVSLWVDYHDEALTLQVGALGLRYTVFPKKETDNAKKADERTATAKKQAAKDQNVKGSTISEPQQSSGLESSVKVNPVEGNQNAGSKITVQKIPDDKQQEAKPAMEQKAEQADTKQQADKSTLLGLTFNQLVTAVRGVGALGKAILCGIKVRHIRVYLPVEGADAADTAIQYGHKQAWLHAGLGFLNRAMWLEFDECYLDADFLQEKQKKERFSCQISAQLIIMVIAVARFIWLLWKANILDALIENFSGNNNV